MLVLGLYENSICNHILTDVSIKHSQSGGCHLRIIWEMRQYFHWPSYKYEFSSFSIKSNNLITSLKQVFQLQNICLSPCMDLCIVISITRSEIHRLLYLDIFLRYPIRKAISNLFLEVDIQHRLIIDFEIISMISIFY